MLQIDLGYVVWSWSGSFGYSKPGGLGPALAMVPTVENFCHAPENIGTAELSTPLKSRYEYGLENL